MKLKMTTIKWLLCAACLCGVSVFSRSALTQDSRPPSPIAEAPATYVQPTDAAGGAAPVNTANLQPSQDANELFPPVSGPRPGSIASPSAARSTERKSSASGWAQPSGFFNESVRGSGSEGASMGGGLTGPGIGRGMGLAMPPGPPGLMSGYPGGMSMGGDMYGSPDSGAGTMRQKRVTRTVTQVIFEPIPKEELEERQRLQAALHTLKSSEDEDARKKAVDIIQQQLSIQFQRDLEQRENELLEVEDRVKSLREQLDKRKTAQADIVNLRLQTLINSANGLGFPGEDLAGGE